MTNTLSTKSNYTTRTTLNRRRENLASEIAATTRARISGTEHVLQRADGAVLSARTGYWTFYFGEAYGVSPETPAILGGTVVFVEIARAKLIEKLEEAKVAVEAALTGG